MKKTKTYILEELLKEVDEDIRNVLLMDSDVLSTIGGMCKMHELLSDPIKTAIAWQEFRNRKL